MPHSGVGRYWEIGGAELGLAGSPREAEKFFDLLFTSVKNYALVASRYIKGHALSASDSSLLSRRTVG